MHETTIFLNISKAHVRRVSEREKKSWLFFYPSSLHTFHTVYYRNGVLRKSKKRGEEEEKEEKNSFP